MTRVGSSLSTGGTPVPRAFCAHQVNLENPKNEALQVVRLGHGGEDRMVDRLRPPLEYLQVPARIMRGLAKQREERRLVDVIRAAGSHQDSLGRQELHGPQVDLLVAALCRR